MAATMHPNDFLQRIMALPGVPWVRWRADWSGCDCFGLVVLWHREVLGVELGPVPETDIADGFALAAGWEPCEPDPGVTAWMTWRNGAPTHCGVLVAADMVLHNDGAPDRPGAARLTRLSAMQRLHQDLRFYRRVVAPC